MSIAYTPKIPRQFLVWRRIYGLGVAWEGVNIASDDLQWKWRVASVKVFVGPLLIRFDVPVTRRARRTEK